jgi:hypothetical protein
MGNSIRTGILLAGLTILMMIIGNLLGGRQGTIIAFVFAVIINFGSYWLSDKIVLRIYRARPVSEAEAPQLHRLVRQLSQQAGLPMPKIFVIPSESPNAFATGRDPNHAVVAVTQGILGLLTEDELKGVLGHELAHVKHGGRHHDDCVHGQMGCPVWRVWGQGRRRGRHHRPYSHVHTGSNRSHADPDGDIPFQGIRSRCSRRLLCREPPWSGEGASKDIFGVQADSYASPAIHSPHVYHESPVRQEHDESLQHPPPCGEAGREADRAAVCVEIDVCGRERTPRLGFFACQHV